MTKRRVVVTGMGAVSPIGVGLENFESGLREMKSGMSRHPEMEKFEYACQVSATMGYTPEDIARINKQYNLVKLRRNSITYAIMSLAEAWQDAGFEFPYRGEEPQWDVGSIYGNESPSLQIFAWAIPTVQKFGTRSLGGKCAQQAQNSALSIYLNKMIGFGNVLYTVSAACSTGCSTIAQSYEHIASGKARIMVTGGAETDSVYMWSVFDSLRALSRGYNDEPERASRPMSASAAGFIPGTGAATLILEDLESAKERGAKIYGEIISGYLNSGGQKNGGSMTLPNPKGTARCISKTLELGGVKPEQLDVISGHLTATTADPLEIEAWVQSLNLPKDEFPLINAPKSLMGHGFGASGALAAAASLLQVKNDFVHGSLNNEDLHPDIASKVNRDKIPQQTIEKEVNHLIQASFGFGDLNCCLLYKKYRD